MSDHHIFSGALPLSQTQNLSSNVRSSWLRCLNDHGLDPHRMPKPHVLTNPEVQDVTAPIEDLIALASPEIRRLFNRLAGDGCLVSLASASGVNLLYRCDYDLADMMESFGVVPGAIWSERNQGTNGIGTCIHTKQAVSIVASDHFDDKLKALSCTDAPVFGPGGRLECVINATTDRPTSHHVQRLVRGIVVRSACRIENTYFIKRYPEARILRLANEIDFIDLASEARLAIDDDDRIIDATSKVGDILTVGLEDLVGRSFYEIFAADRQLENYGTPKALGPGLSQQSRIYALFEESAAVRSVVSRADVAEQQFRKVQGARFDGVFFDHPILATRIPAALRLVRAGAPILLSGEPGVGKEKIARMIFEESEYVNFTVIRCRVDGDKALSEVLSDPGFEGVLYVEDVEYLLPQSQHRLFWQLFGDRTATRVCGEDDDGRRLAVIASCTSLASGWSDSSSLDRQLFDAFGGVTISVPPLRAYPNIDDVIEKVFEIEFRRNNRGLMLSTKVREILRNHLWTGNLGELERVARFTCALCDSGTVEVHHLPEMFNLEQDVLGGNPSGTKPAEAMLHTALRHNNWNVSKTARYLGISRATLYRKMNEAGITRPSVPQSPQAEPAANKKS